MKKLIFILFSFLICNSIYAQLEGVITYKMSADSDDPQSQQQAAMMNGEMKMFFDDQNSKVTVDMAGMVSMETTVNSDSKEALRLLETMGQKIAVETNMKELEKSQKDKNSKVDYEATGETKEILGYSCEKYIIKHSGVKKGVAWLTDEIEVETRGLEQFNNSAPGFPLEMVSEQQSMMITIKAVSFDELDAKAKIEEFDLSPPEDARVMSMEELQSLMSR